MKANGQKTGNQKTGNQRRGRFLSLSVLLIGANLALAQTAAVANSNSQKSSRRVLVSIPDRKLAILENSNVVRTFPVAVGAALSPSPTGEFRIVSRLKDPTYYHTGVMIPPGKDNPIGPRWLGLNKKGYGIHGTNEPKSIGKAASHGCIRMRNRDIERFYQMVSVGDVVEIHGQRDEEIARVFGDPDPEAGVATASVTAVSPEITNAAAGQ
jgi:lipoprotein-anchoring transpeptidase ErfK/SrfK